MAHIIVDTSFSSLQEDAGAGLYVHVCRHMNTCAGMMGEVGHTGT